MQTSCWHEYRNCDSILLINWTIRILQLWILIWTVLQTIFLKGPYSYTYVWNSYLNYSVELLCITYIFYVEDVCKEMGYLHFQSWWFIFPYLASNVELKNYNEPDNRRYFRCSHFMCFRLNCECQMFLSLYLWENLHR